MTVPCLTMSWPGDGLMSSFVFRWVWDYASWWIEMGYTGLGSACGFRESRLRVDDDGNFDMIQTIQAASLCERRNC